jgi:hypothetical protein
MPRFRVFMESQEAKRKDKSPHVRVTVLQADDEDTAVALCERRELQIAAHEYSAETVADLEEQEAAAKDAGARVPAQVRMQLASHRQSKPYVVTGVEEVV